jgi:hypothetical protein
MNAHTSFPGYGLHESSSLNMATSDSVATSVLIHRYARRHTPESSNLNLYEPCVLYIGRAYRYPPDIAFYIYFFNNYKY